VVVAPAVADVVGAAVRLVVRRRVAAPQPILRCSSMKAAPSSRFQTGPVRVAATLQVVAVVAAAAAAGEEVEAVDLQSAAPAAHSSARPAAGATQL
jgi:hypothetical protein